MAKSGKHGQIDGHGQTDRHGQDGSGGEDGHTDAMVYHVLPRPIINE